MPEFTARDVKALREVTGAGMLDAKRALEENDGDPEAAKQWLREKGLARASQRQDRENAEGAVAVAVTENGSAVVELKSETDFVAKSSEFVSLVDDIAQLVAAKGPEAAAERQADVDDLRMTLKENIEVGRVIRFDPVPGAVIGSYLHVQADRGVNAVLVELDGGDTDLAHDIAVHIAFARPAFIARDDVPAAEVDAERTTLEAISRNEGKPEAALEKIVEGRLRGWYKERCLLDQDYVRDEKQTIAKLLGGVKVTRFAQIVVGT
jgi:elongation factor Ts